MRFFPPFSCLMGLLVAIIGICPLHAETAPVGYARTLAEIQLDTVPGVRHRGPALQIPMPKGAGFADIAFLLESELADANLNVISKQDLGKAITARQNKPFPAYVIYHICNLEVGRKIIESEPAFGVFLPCKVVLYEEKMGGRVWAVIYKPGFALAYFPALPTEAVKGAREVGDRLFNILYTLATDVTVHPPPDPRNS